MAACSGDSTGMSGWSMVTDADEPHPRGHLRCESTAALDEFERTLVVLLDKERARVFRLFLGEIEETADLVEATPKKHRQIGGSWAYPPSPDWSRGGGSDSGIVRHEEAHVHWHARHTVDALTGLAASERVDRILIGGAPEMLAEFRHLLPAALRGRVADAAVHAPLYATAAEVLATALPVMERAERLHEGRLVTDMLEAVGSGRAVLGPAAVLDAVLGQRVSLLVYVEDAHLHGRQCKGCGMLLLPPAPHECPGCGGSTHQVADLVEHLIERVVRQGGRIEAVRGPAAERLAAADGIGALVRYPATVSVAAAGAPAGG